MSAAYLRGFFIVDVLSIGLPFGIIDMISEHASPEDVEVIQRVAYIAGLPKVILWCWCYFQTLLSSRPLRDNTMTGFIFALLSFANGLSCTCSCSVFFDLIGCSGEC